MKKKIYLVLMVIFLFFMVSCKNSNADNKKESEDIIMGENNINNDNRLTLEYVCGEFNMDESEFDGVDFDGNLRRLVETQVVRREYHRHIVFTRSLEVERRGILEGEHAGGDGIRTLDLRHAADERADFTVVGSHLKLSPGEYGVVGQRKIAVLPSEYGQLRDLRLGRVRLQLNLSHGSEVGAIGYGEILLQFGAVDFAVDGLLLIRIGVVV